MEYGILKNYQKKDNLIFERTNVEKKAEKKIKSTKENIEKIRREDSIREKKEDQKYNENKKIKKLLILKQRRN